MRKFQTTLVATFLFITVSGCGYDLSAWASPGPDQDEQEVVTIPERMLEDLQEDLDINAIQAAAILGNLAHETGDFRHLQQVGGPSFGYSQWLGVRKSAFFNFADQHGGRHSHEANYGFLIHEITTQYQPMMSRIRAANDIEVASRIFMREFLRPNPQRANFPKRVKYARRYLDGDFDASGCLGEDFTSGNKILACPLLGDS